MSLIEGLGRIASGAPDACLLNSCRLESGGGEAYGVEAISAAFRSAPFAVEVASPLRGEGQLALVSGQEALFADLHGDNVGRLWRIGGPAIEPEPAAAVAFDPDLSQHRAGVFLTPGDHPALEPDAVQRVQVAGDAIIEQLLKAGGFRVRAFVIRAFGKEDLGATLFAVHCLGPNRKRQSTFRHAIGWWRHEASDIIVDPEGPPPACPRLVA